VIDDDHGAFGAFDDGAAEDDGGAGDNVGATERNRRD
jgi:hypothetical protein